MPAQKKLKYVEPAGYLPKALVDAYRKEQKAKAKETAKKSTGKKK